MDRAKLLDMNRETRRQLTRLICSGRKIVQILKKNPKNDADKYDQKDVEHMRRFELHLIVWLKGSCILQETSRSRIQVER